MSVLLQMAAFRFWKTAIVFPLIFFFFLSKCLRFLQMLNIISRPFTVKCILVCRSVRSAEYCKLKTIIKMYHALGAIISIV